jgi:hypothetical protein
MFHVLPRLTLVVDCVLSETRLESGKMRVNAQKVTVQFDKSKINQAVFSLDKGEKVGIISQQVNLADTDNLKVKDSTLEACIIHIINKLLSTQSGIGGVTLASLKASGFLSKDFSLTSVALSEVYLHLLAEGLPEDQIGNYMQATLDLPEAQLNQTLYKSLARRSLGMGLDKIPLPSIAASSVGYVAPKQQGKPKATKEDKTLGEQLDSLATV